MQEEGTSERQEQAQHICRTPWRLDLRGSGEDKRRGHGAVAENSDLSLSTVGTLDDLEQLVVLTNLHFHGIILASG